MIIAQSFSKWKKKNTRKSLVIRGILIVNNIVDKVDKSTKNVQIQNGKEWINIDKKSTQNEERINVSMWIMWISYFPRRDSPISTTFPAPMVINRSPFIQFFNKNFSISSKEGK